DTEIDSSGNSVGSITAQSTVFDFKYENGRTYHNFRAGKYFLPNDEAEQNRLEKLHHFFLLTYGGRLHLAPLENPRKVLDLGTGTGIWAIEFGDEFPDAEVTGIDLSPIQPNWLPENVKFEIDDYEEDWLREPNSYDYIHGRTLMGSVKDWPRLMSQIYDHLAPGGYVELQETDLTGGRSDDGTFRTDSAFGVYQENLKKAGNLAGLPTDAAPMLAQMMLDAGFVEVREHRVKIPVGTWPKDKKLKEIGSWAQEIVADGLEPYCMALFTRVLGMAKEEATQICDNAKKSLGDRSTHMYFFNHFVYGRKP
ncbi:putative TAM domain methyltransferase, partial [Ascobolus immersus RN42]